eukprot:8822486-Prorocentrum_lima.AAC.1
MYAVGSSCATCLSVVLLSTATVWLRAVCASNKLTMICLGAVVLLDGDADADVAVPFSCVF